MYMERSKEYFFFFFKEYFYTTSFFGAQIEWMNESFFPE